MVFLHRLYHPLKKSTWPRGAFSRLKDHVTLRSVRYWVADTKVFALSEITWVGTPHLAVKRLNALRNISVLMCGTNSRWMARVIQHKNTLFYCLVFQQLRHKVDQCNLHHNVKMVELPLPWTQATVVLELLRTVGPQTCNILDSHARSFKQTVCPLQTNTVYLVLISVNVS